MPEYTVPFATSAQVFVARCYVRACVEQHPFWDPSDSEAVEALDSDAVIRKALRLWPDGGWDHFCEYFASDIRAALETEDQRWWAEAVYAARKHVFPQYLPSAAQQWPHRCNASGDEAVDHVGPSIVDFRRDGDTWREIAARYLVPAHVAFAWGVEARVRQAAAFTVRPFRRSAGH